MPADLEARLQRLEDVDAIARLKAAYCAACDDDHDPDAVVALWAEGGTWRRSGRPICDGIDEIHAFMQGMRDGKFIVHSAHMVTNPEIDIDGDTATGAWRFVMLYTNVDGTFHRIIGHYADTFVRTENGWRFASLMSHVEEQGIYVVAD